MGAGGVEEEDEEKEEEGTSVAGGNVVNLRPVDMPINEDTGE
jgi:hypothetical protein